MFSFVNINDEEKAKTICIAAPEGCHVRLIPDVDPRDGPKKYRITFEVTVRAECELEAQAKARLLVAREDFICPTMIRRMDEDEG